VNARACFSIYISWSIAAVQYSITKRKKKKKEKTKEKKRAGRRPLREQKKKKKGKRREISVVECVLSKF
jgi:hypothetical protein